MTATITHVERFTLQVPFVERVRRDMERAGIHTWSELEIPHRRRLERLFEQRL